MGEVKLDQRLAEMAVIKVMLRVLLREWFREHPNAGERFERDVSEGLATMNLVGLRRQERDALLMAAQGKATALIATAVTQARHSRPRSTRM